MAGCEDARQVRDSMGNPTDSGKGKHRKPYEKPTVTKLTPEEAKLKLVHLAGKGDEQAKEMLQRIFPEEAKKLPHSKKKSA